jgi:hypothetical protein
MRLHRRQNRFHKLVSVVALGLLLFLVALPTARAQSAASPAANSDGQIEMNVVHALDAAAQLKPDWITATTVQGVVTLAGTSTSKANRELAASLAAKVPGVTKVVNKLTVGNPQQAGEVPTGAATAQNTPGQAPQQEGSAGQPPADQTGQAGQAGQADSANNADYGAAQGGPGSPADGARAGYTRQGNGFQQQGQPYQEQYPAGPEPPRNPVTLPQGTTLVVRTAQPVSTQMAQPGTPIDFVAARDVYAGGILAIPRGATIHGEVTDVRKAGALTGHPELALKLDAVQLEGNSYPVTANFFKVRGPGKGGRTAASAFGGALLGALVGGAFGGGSGALIGGTAGGLGGTAASAMSHGPQVWIPTESMLTFHLTTPLTVTPVSRQEALRLSSAAPGNGGPVLQRRAVYPTPPPAPIIYPYGYYGGYYPGYYPGYYAPGAGVYFGRVW